MTNTPRVLVVDGLAETETVLRAVLEPHGARVERRRSSDRTLAKAAPPEVIVVDLDDQSAEHQPNAAWQDVPRVLIGSLPATPTPRGSRFLEKPFHYPELVRLVQSLLDRPTEHRRLG